MPRAILITCLLALLGCGRSKSSSHKPVGTATDPVEVCERLGDVCKLDRARLGVCAASTSEPGLVCAPQH